MILDASYTLLVACIALLIGMFVVKFTPFLQKNHIPEVICTPKVGLIIQQTKVQIFYD